MIVTGKLAVYSIPRRNEPVRSVRIDPEFRNIRKPLNSAHYTLVEYLPKSWCPGGIRHCQVALGELIGALAGRNHKQHQATTLEGTEV